VTKATFYPLVFVVVLVSRTAAHAAGVRFNPNSVQGMQLIEPQLLLSRLLETAFYLHSPPYRRRLRPSPSMSLSSLHSSASST
jgi:hypothetical protein